MDGNCLQYRPAYVYADENKSCNKPESKWLCFTEQVKVYTSKQVGGGGGRVFRVQMHLRPHGSERSARKELVQLTKYELSSRKAVINRFFFPNLLLKIKRWYFTSSFDHSTFSFSLFHHENTRYMQSMAIQMFSNFPGEERPRTALD